MGQVLIRDVTLRDGQQSLFATRMNREQLLLVLPVYGEAGFYALEVWGGAVPDSLMRYLQEDPWERLDLIKTHIKGKAKLTALSRGRNLFGYTPYPEDVIEGFNRHAVCSGIDVMRIFDALNDMDNVISTIGYVKKNGGLADGAVCYTVDPQLSVREKIAFFVRRKFWLKKVFNVDYFVQKACLLEQSGADIITIKDMAGLISPDIVFELIPALKKRLRVPVNLHTHCTPGYGLASVFAALINEVDIVDTALYYFAGGSAAPAFELVYLFAKKIGRAPAVNFEAIEEINRQLLKIRHELRDYDEYKDYLPREIDLKKIPAELEIMLEEAVKAATAREAEKLTSICQRIEAFLNFPPPDEKVRQAQIPGGMYTNMLAQLRTAGLENLFERVLKVVPRVRLDSGLPPLVTPTSQIVGAQAVNCVLDENNNRPFYTNVSTNFINLVKGVYGKTPLPVDQQFRFKICGHYEEQGYDLSKYRHPENPVLPEFGGVRLAKGEKEYLLLELFPAVAKTFLYRKRELEYKQRPAEPERKENSIWEELYNYI